MKRSWGETPSIEEDRTPMTLLECNVPYEYKFSRCVGGLGIM